MRAWEALRLPGSKIVEARELAFNRRRRSLIQVEVGGFFRLALESEACINRITMKRNAVKYGGFTHGEIGWRYW